MKYNLFYCCVVIICMAFIGCSDDSDKLDAFFKDKIAKFESIQPAVPSEVYPNAAILVKYDRNYLDYNYRYFLINTNREELLSEDEYTSIEASTYEDHEDGGYYYYLYLIQDLEPGTTYYYRERISYEQVNISGSRSLYSSIQSFTTSKLTAGEISENYSNSVYISPALYLNSSSKVKVTVEYSLSSNLANSKQYYKNSWSDYSNYVYLSSLEPNTTYYYRLIVTINNKEFRSPISSFTTASK